MSNKRLEEPLDNSMFTKFLQKFYDNFIISNFVYIKYLYSLGIL